MSAAAKFTNLRSQVKPNAKIALYLRTCKALISLRWHSRITTFEYAAFCDQLDDATWGEGTIDAIRAVRCDIAQAVK